MTSASLVISFHIIIIRRINRPCANIAQLKMLTGGTFYISRLYRVILGVWVVVDRSLDHTTMSRMFVSHLCAISGGCQFFIMILCTHIVEKC